MQKKRRKKKQKLKRRNRQMAFLDLSRTVPFFVYIPEALFFQPGFPVFTTWFLSPIRSMDTRMKPAQKAVRQEYTQPDLFQSELVPGSDSPFPDLIHSRNPRKTLLFRLHGKFVIIAPRLPEFALFRRQTGAINDLIIRAAFTSYFSSIRFLKRL